MASAASSLPPAPPSVADASGAPRFGTWQGGLDAVDLSRLTGRYQPGRLGRRLVHKRWLYGFVATREVAALFAVVDLGYASNAFTLAVDLASGELLADHGVLGPPRPLVKVNEHPGAGLEVAFHRPDLRVRAWRGFGDERYHGEVRLGLTLPLVKPALCCTWDLVAAGAAPPLTVIAPVGDAGVNVTQKWAGLAASGALEVRGRRWSLDGGVGGLDVTSGYLARRTAWRWAFACGRLPDGTPLGLNLVEGFNEARDDVNENALWLGGALVPLGRARFTWNRDDVRQPWQVRTVDGAVHLRFRPLAVHAEARDLKVLRSRFQQPVGLWEGEVRVGGRTLELRELPGVAEDQDVLW